MKILESMLFQNLFYWNYFVHGCGVQGDWFPLTNKPRMCEWNEKLYALDPSSRIGIIANDNPVNIFPVYFVIYT